MEKRSVLITCLELITDFLVFTLSQIKAVVKFLIWQWRSKQSLSVIRSFTISLHAQIGKRVIIEKDVFIDGLSRVGDYSYVNPHSSIEDSVIGKFCSIARGVMIGPADHNYSNLSTHPFWYQAFYGFDVQTNSDQLENKCKKTIIFDDVWIGCNAIIRRGVTIQKGAVIGAGSIVTKDVGPYEIWAGIPAKKISQRFDSKNIEELMLIDWCDFTNVKINSIIVPNIDSVEQIIVHTTIK